jgi:hypothetical protein
VGKHKCYKSIEIILDTSKEVDLEVNAKETKYILMFCNQNAGQTHSLETDSVVR